MQLKCKVCNAIQPVTSPDIDDEDARTQSIRRTFRAEHVEKCGEGSVKFELTPEFGGELVVDGILDWAKDIDRPYDVTPQQDGTFRRTITRDGAEFNVLVCENCWQSIPRYVDFPFGLISPESDGDADGNGGKFRRIAMDTATPKAGVMHLPKVLCLPCYIEAFSRVYPNAAPPALRDDVVGDGAPVQPPPPPSEEYAQDPLRELVV